VFWLPCTQLLPDTAWLTAVLKRREKGDSDLEITCCSSFAGKKEGGSIAQDPKNAPLRAQGIPDWLPGSLLWNIPLPLQPSSCILTSALWPCASFFRTPCDCLFVWACLSFAALTGLLYQLTSPLILESCGMPQLDPVITLWFESCAPQFPVTAEEKRAEVGVQAPFSHRTGVDICRIPKQLVFSL